MAKRLFGKLVIISFIFFGVFAHADDSEAPERFMMFSAYNLAPYSLDYETNVLSDLAVRDVAGIFYGTLGFEEHRYETFFAENPSNAARPEGLKSEPEYKSELFSKAKAKGARSWLQLRVYDNHPCVDRNGLECDERAENPFNSLQMIGANDSFVWDAVESEITRIVSAYLTQVSRNDCRIIVFEEAGIYHTVGGGGQFWAGGNQIYDAALEQAVIDAQINGENRPSLNVASIIPEGNRRHWDRVFAYRMTNLYPKIHNHIESLAASQGLDCEIGIHVGHSAVTNLLSSRADPKKSISVIGRAINDMPLASRPDFMFYDLYVENQPSDAVFKQKVSDRIKRLKDDTGLPVFFLGQLHVTNQFISNAPVFGQSPTRDEITSMVTHAVNSGASGVGYYTKNTASNCVSDGFIATVSGQSENSKCVAPLTPLPFDFARNVSNIARERSDPLGILREPQKTVFESTKNRWDLGMEALFETSFPNRDEYFDLVLFGKGFSRSSYIKDHRNQAYPDEALGGRGRYGVYLRNLINGSDDYLGVLDPTDKGALINYENLAGFYAFRGMKRSKYISSSNEITVMVRREGNTANEVPGRLYQMFILPSRGVARFIRVNKSHADNSVTLINEAIRTRAQSEKSFRPSPESRDLNIDRTYVIK